MDDYIYIKVFLGLVIVVSLIGLLAFIAKRFNLSPYIGSSQGKDRRLKIMDSLIVDTKRRLVIFARDDVEHLVLLNKDNDLLIETNIKTKGKK